MARRKRREPVEAPKTVQQSAAPKDAVPMHAKKAAPVKTKKKSDNNNPLFTRKAKTIEDFTEVLEGKNYLKKDGLILKFKEILDYKLDGNLTKKAVDNIIEGFVDLLEWGLESRTEFSLAAGVKARLLDHAPRQSKLKGEVYNISEYSTIKISINSDIKSSKVEK